MAITAAKPNPEEASLPSSKAGRTTIILTDEARSDLTDLAVKQGRSVAELVRTALSLLKLMSRETAQGNRLVVVDPKGDVKREILLPE